MKAKNEFMVKPYSKLELSKLYGVSVKTLSTWMKPFAAQIGPKAGRFYTVKQIEFLFEYLGLPYSLEIKNIKIDPHNVKPRSK